jgi:hypothetical protein
MIRRDYFMRMAQELMQTLQRATFLKDRQQYDRALDEIDRALASFWDLTPQQTQNLSLEDWIALCISEEGGVGEKLTALADLFLAHGELRDLLQQTQPAQHSYAIALGLYLETLRGSLVSMDLIAKTDHLIELTRQAARPPAVLHRMLCYFEARGMFAQAEDILFQWLETNDAEAKPAGLDFYERLLAKPDEELTRGDLPRPEIEQARSGLQATRQVGTPIPN